VQYSAVCCSVLQCVAVCCSVLQCGAVHFNAFNLVLQDTSDPYMCLYVNTASSC